MRAWRHVAVLTLVAAFPVGAQGVPGVRPAPADVAMQDGDLEAAERALYAAARRAPRDPAARGALGAWLAARGQFRVGAVLLEEARLFGAEPGGVAARLQHVYIWLRDWASLAALPASPLSAPERTRARLLAERGTEVLGADSTRVTFAPLEVGALGRVMLRVGVDTLWADVDPQVEGLVLPGLGAGGGSVDAIGSDRYGVVAIARDVALGELTVRNVPARIDAALGDGRARMGFDFFAMLAPTVDAAAGVVTLRRNGKYDATGGDAGMPFLLGFPGVRVATRPREGLAALTSPAGRAALRGRLWSVDARRGMIWLASR